MTKRASAAQGRMGGCGARSTKSTAVIAHRGLKRISLVFWIVLAAVLVVHAQGQRIAFTATPPAYSNAYPTFQFDVVVDASGANPCAEQCSFQCQLDEGGFQDCSGRTISYSNVSDGFHKFTVSANTSNGTPLTSMYAWTVDTVPPTASLVADSPLFTNEVNITVNVTFSEVCSGGRSFQCSSTGSCDLVVRGEGAALPSTFTVVTPGLKYSVQVGLSTQTPTPTGKVTVTTPRQICTDAAGNPYQRSPNSTIVVRFSRVQPTVNLWTPIPNSQVVIGDQARTVQATNIPTGVQIYLDFSEPILGTGEELLSALDTTYGRLLPAIRKSRGNRRFAFSLSLNETPTAAVRVTLPGNTTASRYGVLVQETSVSFLYDIDKPRVLLSTTVRAHTRDRLLPVIVQFTKPVFAFNNSGVTLTGGVLRSFQEITKTTYALVVYAMESSTVRVSVAENRTLDVAGNPNIASSMLQIKQYSSTPAISIALYSFITAGLLGTALASGALAISSANLAAAGVMISGRPASCVGADASRNLLGMAGHMQVIALSSFLATSLPVDYAETANGLRWLIPHVRTPWQKNEDINYTTSFASNVQTNLTLSIRRSLSSNDAAGVGELQLQALFPACRMRHQYKRHDYYNEELDACEPGVQGRRRLGSNGTEFGPVLLLTDYNDYFLNQGANLRLLKDELIGRKYTGLNDFQRNIFWLAVVCGGLILLHVTLLLFLRWRTNTPLHGALSFPRFEIFLLILTLPAISQASAFVIRGGTRAGIIVGVLLLIILAFFVIMVALLLIFGIFLGKRVQYKEFRPHWQPDGASLPAPPTGKPWSIVTGAGYQAKWTRQEGTSSAFIPRWGVLFEDWKGPPRLFTDAGLRRNPTMNSDEEHEERTVSRAYTALGCFQAAYGLVDILRRVALGLVFGAFRVSENSWTQVSLLLAITAVQFLYLVVVKPFQRHGVQLVETVSLLCEMGIFVAAMVILAQSQPHENHSGIGVLMLVFFLVSFVAQVANEWFALIRQLLSLSNSNTNTDETSPGKGLRKFAVGLVLPFLPRSRWPQLTAVTPPSNPPVKSPVSSYPLAANAVVDADTRPSTSQGKYSSSPDVTLQSPKTLPAIFGVTKSAKPTVAAVYWPGEDLQEWARQNSLERRRQETETELVVNSMVQEISPADLVISTKYHASETPLSVGRSRQRRHRIHSSDSLSDVPSDGGISLDLSQEFTHSIQV